MTQATASESRPSNEEFDYVIVGAGPSAMGLLLGLLEPYIQQGEDLPFSIAILERGPQTNHNDTRVHQQDLRRWFEASHDPSSPTVSLLETSLRESGRLVTVPIGRGVGGGSNVNAGLCVPPPASDFQEWPEPWKSNLSNSIQYLLDKLSANHCLWDAASGKEWTKTGSDESVPCLAKPCKNNNLFQSHQRVNYYEALIEPLLSSKTIPNLTWFCNAKAQRLMRDGNKITGVEITMKSDNPLQSIIRARKEVLLCAGVMETPVLLLASGIGPKHSSSLAGIAVPTTIEIEAIGKGLQDHVILPRVLLGLPPNLATTRNGIHAMKFFQVEGHNFLLMTSTTTPEAALHFFSRILYQYWGSVFPNLSLLWYILQGLLQVLVLYTPLYYFIKYGLTTMNLALVNPQSTGSIRLQPKPQRNDHFEIQLDLGYLQHHGDIDALWRGWVASPLLLGSRESWWELYPGKLFPTLYGLIIPSSTTSKQSTAVPNWFTAFAQDTSLPFFHWCGTCAMKMEGMQDWVVDSSCRVRSIQALRICDASVLPHNLSVPPALTCAAMGHLLARQILDEQQ